MVSEVNSLSPIDFDSPNLGKLWTTFKQKLGFYLHAKQLADADDATKVGIMMNSLGDKGVHVYNSLKLDDTKTYDQVIQAFDDYCNPKSNTVYERYLFNLIFQKEGQTFDSFVTELKMQALLCDFETQSDNLIRDRIVCGVRDSALTDSLLRAKKLTLATAESLGRSAEASKRQTERIHLSTEKQTVSNVDILQRRNAARTSPAKPSGPRGGSGQMSKQPQPSPDQQSRKPCRNCGYFHQYRRCPAYNNKCYECNELHHFAKVCRNPKKRDVNAVNAIETSEAGNTAPPNDDRAWYSLNDNEKHSKSEYDIQCAVTKAENDLNIVLRIFKAIYTFIAFFFACCLVPWLFITFLAVRICRHFFVRWLQRKFKGLEFVRNTTVRTAVDTQRNQGIVTVLLTVKGPCQLNLIKNRIQADIIQRTKNGEAVFPHLRTILTSRWGNYAWVKGSEKQFRIDNQIVLASGNFKGRPVSDANIQEYISDIIAKLLPAEFPPWQITLIPTQQDKTYLLIRLHHLYLSEDGLSLGELLLLRAEDPAISLEPEPWGDRSLLSGVFRAPVFIPQVYENLCESTSNWWNEVLYNYDPTDNPTVLKDPTLTIFATLCVMTAVSAVKEYLKTENSSLWDLLALEKEKKGLNSQLFWRSFHRSFSILNIFGSILRWIARAPMSIIRFPVLFFKVALDSPVYLYWLYMAHYVVQEIIYLFKIFYSAPRIIFEEIFLPEHPRNVHQLQTLSFCGRKVVNWSAPVPLETIEQLQRVTGSTVSEIAMSAVASSLRDYFESAGFAVPDAVMTTCFFVAQEDLFTRRGQLTSGMLCLPLPTRTPKENPTESLRALRTSLYKARSTQAPLYLASVYQMDYRLFTTIFPTLFARACLYLLSRRYTVTVTQVDSTKKGENMSMQMLWGQRVERVMYWRPPQANVGLSLTLMNYGDSVQVGVMADAQLAPQFSKIVTSFPTNVYKLARSLGVTSSPAPSKPVPAF